MGPLNLRPPTDERLITHTPALSHGLPPGLLDPNKRTAQIDLHGLVEAGQIDVDRTSVVRIGGGVVDEDVEAPESLDGGGHAGVGLVGIADVSRVDRSLPVNGRGGGSQGVDLA